MTVCTTCAGRCRCDLIAEFSQDAEVRAAHHRGDATALVYLAGRNLGLSQAEVAHLCGLSQGFVSRVLSGQRTIKEEDRKRIVLARFAPPDYTPQPAGPAPITVTENDLDSAFGEVTAMAAFGDLGGPALGLVDRMHPVATTPARLGAQDVAHLETITDMMERTDFLHGGGMGYYALIGQLRHACELYRHTSCSPAVRTALESALARLCKVAAWSAFDGGDMDVSRRCWILGLSMARRATDHQVMTSLLTDMARASIHHGHPDQALQQLGMAGAFAPTTTATLRTALAVVTARAHGSLGAERDCLYAIDTAHAHFDRRDPDREPAWMGFWNSAQLAGDTGQALVPLALHQGRELDRAVQLLDSAVREHAPEEARAAVLSHIKLARLHLAAGDTDRARQSTRTLVETAPTIRSARVRRDLADLADDTIPLGCDPDATWVRHSIEHTLRSAQDPTTE